jgi:hypothetical protein
VYLGHLLVLLLPHLIQLCQALIACLLPLKRIQCLYQYLLHAWIPPYSQQFLDCLDEFGIDISGESLAWVICQNPNEHYAIVLNVRFRGVVFREVLSDHKGSLFGRSGRGLARFDNRWKVENFFALKLD